MRSDLNWRSRMGWGRYKKYLTWTEGEGRVGGVLSIFIRSDLSCRSRMGWRGSREVL